MSHDLECVIWSRRRWIGWVVCVLTFQLCFVMLLSSRREASTRRSASSTVGVGMLMGSRGERAALESLGVLDPSLFAVAHRDGFSAGTARLPAPEAPAMAAILEPPYWLTNGQPSRANSAVPSFGETAERSPAGTVERVSADFSTVNTMLDHALNQTHVWFEGELMGRRVKAAPQVTALVHAEVPQASVVQLAVDAEGVPQSVRLLSSSGVGNADQAAIRSARALRFEPSQGAIVGSTALTWGSAIFGWQVRNGAETNRSRN